MTARTVFFCSVAPAIVGFSFGVSAANPPVYRLSVAVDFDRGTFEGEVDVCYESHATVPLDEVYFRLRPNEPDVFGSAALEVTAASVNGQVAVAEPTSGPHDSPRASLSCSG